ncbi:hypothetical protein M4S82_07985 [Planococcus sp. MERTA32b]|nr:hypothetical protein [Planococcus sp. MER TA 32b]
MKTITSMNEYRQIISSAESFLLFVKTDNCSVCEGLHPKFKEFEEGLDV